MFPVGDAGAVYVYGLTPITSKTGGVQKNVAGSAERFAPSA